MDKAVDWWITGARAGNAESLSALEVNSPSSEKARDFIRRLKKAEK